MKENLFDSLVVVKRSGQRCDFQGEKIAIAIKKAFDSVGNDYDSKHINVVYHEVLEQITKNYQGRKTIKIEDIQDLIMDILLKKKYSEVYESFKNYRERRAISRESFISKEQHKFLKAMENLGLNEKEDPKLLGEKLPPIQMFHNFGSVISKKFAESYLLDHKTVRNMDSGILQIHGLEYYPMGNPYSLQLKIKANLEKLEQKNIFQVFLKLSQMIRSVFDEQTGHLVIPSFETELEPFLIQAFAHIWQETLSLKLSSFGLEGILPMDEFREKVMNLTSLSISLESFSFFYQNSKPMENLFVDSYRESLEVLQENLTEAMIWFLDELDFTYQRNLKKQIVTFSIGTNPSLASMMIGKILISVGKGKKSPATHINFKLKESIHFNPKKDLYELYKLSESAFLEGVLSYSFLDVPYNQNKEDVCYNVNGERVFEDNTTLDAILTGEKGSMSFVTINLPRIALKHQNEGNLDLFYQELVEVLESAKNEILERFEYQCSKHNYNFPTLIKAGFWTLGETVKESDRLRKIWKHGTLQISFVGLSETMQIMFGEKMDNSDIILKESYHCISFLREKINEYSKEYNLNFALCGYNLDNVNETFFALDEVIYGKGNKNQSFYSETFHFNKKMDWKSQISIEGPFHQLCNGGHCFLLQETPKIPLQEVLNEMIRNGIGFTRFCKR